MSEPKLSKTKRHLPHWELPGSTYFITFRLKQGEMTHAERELIFDHIKAGEEKFYCLFAMVVMPDHVHLLLRPSKGVELWRIMQGIKGVTARLVNKQRNASGPLWLGESCDRIIRDEAEAIEKQNYIYEKSGACGVGCKAVGLCVRLSPGVVVKTHLVGQAFLPISSAQPNSISI